jgi:hypothetical protein
LLKTVKGKVQEELLTSTLPGLVVTISGMQLPEMIDNAEKEINEIVEGTASVRVFVKTDNFSFRLTSSEMDMIFPKELISFRALPVLKKTCSKIKSDLLKKLEEVQAELINLGNMVDFSIESAITALSTKELPDDEVKEMAIEGMKLSYEKNEEIKNIYQNICSDVVKGTNKSVLSFNEEVFGFTRVSKINSVRVQLERNKAKLKVQKDWDNIYSSIKNFVPMLLTSITKFFRRETQTELDTLNLKKETNHNTEDISEYLKRLNSSLEKIPYIYHRLFQLKPLENERLYIKRKEEEEQLKNAFNKWMRGEYSPVILTSEKGDGVTTFINIVVPELSKEINISRITVKSTLCTEDKLLRLFNTIANPEGISDYTELTKILNTSKSKRIIVIENLQHVFLRTVGGFKCINILMEIISKTNKNVFWIATSTNFAFEYLRKTIKLDDYFAYHIKFQAINNQQVTDLIKKRNSISGYKLHFEINPDIPGGKELSRLAVDEAQKLLEKEFFISLNKKMQSNISLALLFWLRTIKEINDRTLLIKPKLEINHYIFSSLSPEKTFILQSLVLHDGLKLEGIQKTVNFSLSKTNLLVQVMCDDGIINKEDDTFCVNPLLYTQTIKLLKSKNFLS